MPFDVDFRKRISVHICAMTFIRLSNKISSDVWCYFLEKTGWSLELSYLPFQGQFRGRTEIAPDQREKYVQRLQQVQQQGHSTLLSMPPLSGGNHKQFSAQQQSPLLQQVLFLVCSFNIFGCVLSLNHIQLLMGKFSIDQDFSDCSFVTN